MSKLTMIKIFIMIFALSVSKGYSQNSVEFPDIKLEVNQEKGLMKINDSKEKIFSVKSNEISYLPFEIISEGNVILNIYNENGYLVQTLVDGYMYPGFYNVIFKPEQFNKSNKYYYKVE